MMTFPIGAVSVLALVWRVVWNWSPWMLGRTRPVCLLRSRPLLQWWRQNRRRRLTTRKSKGGELDGAGVNLRTAKGTLYDTQTLDDYWISSPVTAGASTSVPQLGLLLKNRAYAIDRSHHDGRVVSPIGTRRGSEKSHSRTDFKLGFVMSNQSPFAGLVGVFVSASGFLVLPFSPGRTTSRE